MNTEYPVKIGWAEQSITPTDKKLSLRGQFYERISEYVESPVTVTAMAVECGEGSMVICSCDLTSVEVSLVSRVRELLAGKVGFPLDRLIVCCTHTHTSHTYAANAASSGSALHVLSRYMPDDMVYRPLVDTTGVMDPVEAFEFLAQRISLAASQAWENRAEALYACGFGRAAVGMCRRVCFNDGSARMWGDADNATFTELEGGNDSGVELIYTFDRDKRITGVVANIACPSQVLEHRSFVSSDYWGKAKKILREKISPDLFLLPLCSAAGDQCPRDLVRWIDPETPINDPNIDRPHPRFRRADPSMFDLRGAGLVGKRVANEIISVLEDVEAAGEYVDRSVLIHDVRTLDLPLRRVTPAENENAKTAIKEFVRDNRGRQVNYMDTAMMHVHAGTIARFEYQYDHDCCPIELHCVRFGDVAFATNPFELFLDYGNQIRARSLAAQTFLLQLSNGCCGYLPTEKAEKGGHYSAYVSSGQVGHEGGDLLVRETLSVINSMFAEA